MATMKLADIVREYSPITNPESIVSYIQKARGTWFRSSWEKMGVIPVNSAGYPLGIEFVSEGSECGTQMCISKMFKLIFGKRKYASATGFILVHNHPSGNSMPSDEDMDVTRRAIDAGNVLGFKLIDHIIITPLDCKIYSFCRERNEMWD